MWLGKLVARLLLHNQLAAAARREAHTARVLNLMRSAWQREEVKADRLRTSARRGSSRLGQR